MLATMIGDDHLPNQEKVVERNIYGGLKEKKSIFDLSDQNIKEQSLATQSEAIIHKAKKSLVRGLMSSLY